MFQAVASWPTCPWSHSLSWWLYGVFSMEKIFVIRPLQERQNQSLSCVGAQHRNAHAKTCYSTHHEHGMNFHIDSCLTSLDRYRKSFDQSSLSLSLVLCSETFGMDTLTCCSNKCLVEHHSLGIFTQAVLWLYGSPPLWCVGMSRVCPWSTLWPVTSQVESQVQLGHFVGLSGKLFFGDD